MKIYKRKFFSAAIIVALFSLLACLICLPTQTKAKAVGAYDYTVRTYDVQMEVEKDASITVQETFLVYFTGYDSHGVIRDFPLGEGVRYSDFSTSCDNSDFSPYFQSDDAGVLSLYLRGAGRVQGQERTYTVSYKVYGFLADGVLPLEALGYGMPQVESFTGKITVPDGLQDFEVNSNGYLDYTRSGNVIELSGENVRSVKVDLVFEDGVISRGFDHNILWAILLGVGVLLAAVLIKVLLCKEKLLVRPVSFEAPDKMDPLRMGKIIDNKVDGEDMGALVFWLASEGYLKIDLAEDEDDPLLTRTEKPLPSDIPSHVKVFMAGLFRGNRSVRVSALKNTFYTTADEVRKLTDFSAGTLYSRRGKIFVALVGVIATLLLGGFFWISGLARLAVSYHYWFGFVVALATYAIGALSSVVAIQRKYKWKKSKRVFLLIGCVLLGSIPGLIAFLIQPGYCMPIAVWIATIFATLSGVVGGSCLVRTDEYNELLGRILGFKDFIAFTERDKIEAMLKIDPELYYKILPYAQVLGVSDAWTDKFKGLDLHTPVYINGAGSFVYQYAMFRAFSLSFAHNAVSRPSTQGKGGFGGGHFGGGGGGGFGGGGMRGC